MHQQENKGVEQNTEKDANRLLKEIYSLEHLYRHEVYMTGDEMNVDLWNSYTLSTTNTIKG